MEGKCDDTGEDLVRREDDSPENVENRLKDYEAMTKPLNDYYNGMGILRSFQGETSDVIFGKVDEWLKTVC